MSLKFRTCPWEEKKTLKIMKRQATHWGKMFAKYIINKELEFRICKELSKFNNKKPNRVTVKKVARIGNQKS
jgi:hypothetical protein